MGRFPVIMLLAMSVVFVFQVPFVQGATLESADQSPSALCWTQSQCQGEYQRKASSGDRRADSWIFDTQSFIPNDSCPTNQGYCYAPIISYELIIGLGAVTQVEGIGGYVRALYSLAIVIGAVVSVLTIMIAGLRWMVARGNPGATGEAQKMIGKSIVSMLILLSVVTLANLIDPTLTVLNPLRTPLIKQVDYIPDDSACDYLQSLGFTIDPALPSGNTCGKQGKITALTSDTGEDNNVFIGPSIGDSCTYRGCSGDTSCVQFKKEWTCMACGDITGPSAASGTSPVPSDQQCAALSRSKSDLTAISSEEAEYLMCAYLDADTLSANSNTCVQIVYPSGQNTLSCARLRTEAQNLQGGVSCAMYNLATAFSNSGLSFGTYGSGSRVGHFAGANDRYDIAKNVCERDVCGVAPPGSSCALAYEPGWVESAFEAIRSGLSSYTFGLSNILIDPGDIGIISESYGVYCVDAANRARLESSSAFDEWTILDENGSLLTPQEW